MAANLGPLLPACKPERAAVNPVSGPGVTPAAGNARSRPLQAHKGSKGSP
jgi:hypothetical protein